MKKKLLKPPNRDGEILFLPEKRLFLNLITEKTLIGVCHQPYFFNPGVSLQFLFLNNLARGEKKFVFMDIDRVRLEAMVPFPDKSARIISLVNSDDILRDFYMPDIGKIDNFFSSLEKALRNTFPETHAPAVENFAHFRKIFYKNRQRRYLKEILAESFVEFYDLDIEYSFLSDMLSGEEFKDFFMTIYKDRENFRRLFNEALREYKEEYKFRYKNFPFPPLEEGELPFWLLEGARRVRCFSKDVEPAEFEQAKILPRAATLTIFLRLHKFDLFIHGTGGANYETIQDKLIERFFKRKAPQYAVISATFLLENFKEREFPYFFFSPGDVSSQSNSLCRKELRFP